MKREARVVAAGGQRIAGTQQRKEGFSGMHI